MIDLVERDGPARDERFLCSKCNNDFFIIVSFGCFVQMDNRSFATVVRERPGQLDVVVRDVWCPKCGCSGGLTKVSEPKP